MKTILLLTLILSLIQYTISFTRPAYLKCGQYLRQDEYLQSTNGYYLVLQGDCNLVIYRSKHFVSRNILWQSFSTNTNCSNPYFINQTDGNQVIYNGGIAIWSSQTVVGPLRCYQLAMQDDGNLALYTENNNLFWSTKTAA